ncbi:vitellogenin-2-like isoform X2 [Hemicordylus capensis]|uniref:vitellogenin-2-like isoform X2 n=1 Tax=Hemicordylus capensis TaxID=884348 RepID=UPI00230293FC|nr:vitellogenin-2-like isoform X2 [Hemicordylus capensis]
MRGIVLALLVTFVGSQKYDLEAGFSNAKTYVYHYQGFILNGLPEKGLAKSGLKLTCKVEISRVSQEFHLIKVLSPQLEEYNGIWPRDPFTNAHKLTQQIGLCFTQPFKFHYIRGHVENIHAPKDIPVLCVNIMKGILNLLPITMKESERTYELQEAGVEGTCHTRYIIQDDRKNNRAIVSRTKDLNNCVEKVVKNIGMAYIRPCPQCSVKAGNTRGTAVLTHILKYTDTGALIIHAESEQVYEISPFNEPSGTATIEARQNLTLIETKSNQETIPDIQLQNHGNLHYQFPEDLPQMAFHLIKTKNPEAGILETLQQLTQQSQLQIHAKMPVTFLELIELSRLATRENLESVWKQSSDRQHYRYLLLSAIATAGTTNTFMFLKQIIQNEDLSFLESTLTLPLAFHLTKTDSHTLKVAADLITSHGVQKSLALRNLAYLAYGSMICRHCSVSSSCSSGILKPLHDLTTNATTEDEIVLALKAIGNAGEPASIKYIKKFLPGFSPTANALPERIYINAVLALRKIARKQAAEVQGIILQIFMDQSLPPNVRMVACVVFFETKPALPLVTAMTNFVQKKNSLQVASFVYSHMKALALGKIPQLNHLSTACRIAIRLLNPRLDELSYRYSKVIHTESYSSVYRAGAIGRLYLMNSPRSVFPSGIIAKMRGYYATSAMDIVEVAFWSQGLMDILKKQKTSFDSTHKTMKKLGKLVQGWKELPLEKPVVSAYLKLFSHEIAFGSVDKELIQKMMKYVTEPEEKEKLVKQIITLFQKGLEGKWIQPVLVGELRHIVPTCVGVPVEMGLYSISMVHAMATVNGQISLPLTGDFRLKQLLKAKVQLSANVNTSIYTDLMAVMGINTPYFQTGLEFHAKFHASMPVKFDAKIDMNKESFKFEATPVQQETELLGVRTKLYAVSRNVDEPDSVKRTPVVPEVAELDDADQQLKSSERSYRDNAKKQRMSYETGSQRQGYGLKKDPHQRKEKISCPNPFCIKILGMTICTCVTPKLCNAACLHKFAQECEINLTVKPEAARTKIQLEIKSNLGSETTELGHSEEEYEALQAKVKKPKFLKPQKLVAVLRTIQNDKKVTRFHLVVRADLHSSIPTVEAVVSEGSNRMKFCAHFSIRDSQKAEGYLTWGQECRDYKIAARFAYGHYAGYPALELKVLWPQIPTSTKAAIRRLFTLIPGIVYVLGLPQRKQKNPSQEASVVVALTSPRSCYLVFKLPDITIYAPDIMLPFSLPVSQHTEVLAMQPHPWSLFSDVPSLVLENLKAHCSVSQDSFTTFNGVRFNYGMPAGCYHILAQDCTSGLKFLVMAKKADESNQQITIHIKLANHEIDMYPSNGLVKLRLNGVQKLSENLPYSSNSGVHIRITSENGLLLQAPETGVEKLYYDGHMLKIQVPFWMTGKTCGICGRYDGEYEQEYKMPSGYVAEDTVSFAESWILPEDSCARAETRNSTVTEVCTAWSCEQI